MHEIYSRLGVLSGGVLTSGVGLDGPVMGKVLPEDLVVLDAGTDGLSAVENGLVKT